jgi:FkbM family methyltransferase
MSTSEKLIKSLKKLIFDIDYLTRPHGIIPYKIFKMIKVLYFIHMKNYVYTNFLKFISKKIEKPEIILDLGARDAIQSIEFAYYFPDAQIYSFECNPSTISRAIQNTKKFKNIKIVPKAVYSEDTHIDFFPVITSNDGASSIFRASGEFDEIEKLPQTKISVEATRIDTWAKENNIEKIDLCWIDLQGAEYNALIGMGNMLKNVQALYSEVEFREIYSGQKLFSDLKDFLEEKGFKLLDLHIAEKDWWGNAIFINNKIL